jgi:Zn-dependent M16 (insulinase) family peptidase
MWRQVRGLGLSYGYSIIPRPQEGLLYLSFYRATNCVLAYKEAKNIVVSSKEVEEWNFSYILQKNRE